MKRIYSIITKSTYLVISLLSVILTCIYSPTFATGFTYYATLINLLSFLFIAFILINEIQNKFYQTNVFHTFRGIILIGLITMFIVYYFILAGNDPKFYFFNWANIFAKILSPLLFLLDYILFDRKQELKISDLSCFLLIPVVYIIYVYISAMLGGLFYVDFNPMNFSKFPYFFLNIELIGFGNVCLWVLGIGAGILVLSLGLIALDHFIPKWIAWIKASPEERKNKSYIKPKTSAVSMGLPTDEE